MSQKGNAFVRAEIQDYTGSIEISCNRENHKKFGHLFKKGEVLFIEGMMSPSYGNSDNYYFTLKKVCLLETVGKMLTKSITLQLPINRINEKMVEDLKKLCSETKGEHALKMVVQHRNANETIKLNLVSENYMVNASADFISALREIGIDYKLN